VKRKPEAPRAFARGPLGGALLCLGAVAQAQDVPPQTVVVTATRIARPAFEVPAAVDVVGADAIHQDRLQVNLSESLAGVPGLLARDRQNYAQDVQLSVRGFGARSTFGIRGVRLYVDDIPATLPDGQGQITNVDLASADRIEVLRGPFSALYGNAAGGVVRVFTQDGAGPPTATAGVAAGSDGVRRESLTVSGSQGALGYVLSGSHFETDGSREHSAATRNIGNAKLNWKIGADDRLTFVANSVALPRAQDPLGLTRAEYEADPRGADPVALQFDTRKTMHQSQAGLVFEHDFTPAQTLRTLAYDGSRTTLQFQAIPVAPQNNPLHPGGVIDLARRYRGTELRYTASTDVAGVPVTAIAGFAWDVLQEHRVGYQNFVDAGATLGVFGELRRDEGNRVASTDPYLQLAARPAPGWLVEAGVRRSAVRFVSHDHYVVGANPDDSGGARYAATLPVLSVSWQPAPALQLYANAGKGFETPTLNELAYRPDGATGLNFALRPATSRSIELGAKFRWDASSVVDAAVFDTRTDDEIVTLSNVGGRATYQNAGATRRVGAELSLHAALGPRLQLTLAATRIEATYRDAFATCAGSPCPVPTVQVAAGSRMPGIPRGDLYAALDWRPAPQWVAGANARYTSSVPVNDIGSDAAPAFAIAGLHLGHEMRLGATAVTAFARVDNLFDRTYVGSVIVNEGNARYFEPAPGRSWTLGLTAAF
jgi:iron complex outermembrane receptor protein